LTGDDDKEINELNTSNERRGTMLSGQVVRDLGIKMAT